MNNVSQWTYAWAKLQKDLFPMRLETIDSTNTFAKTVTVANGKNQIIIADQQTQGRGRGTNTWISPEAGTSLLSSWVFDLNFTPQPILPALVGLSVYEALLEIGGITNLALKAPNDIFMSNKKAGGILIENLSQGSHNRLIIGIGMNIFKTPKVDIATCVQDSRSDKIDDCAWSGFLIELYKRLKTSVQESKNKTLTTEKSKKILEALNKLDLLKEKYLEVLPSGEIKTPKGVIPWMNI